MSDEKKPKVLDKQAISILLVSFGFILVYNHFILPHWFPPQKPTPQQKQGGNVTTQNADQPANADNTNPVMSAARDKDKPDKPDQSAEGEPDKTDNGTRHTEPPTPAAKIELIENLVLEVPEGQNKLRATFTNRGAVVTRLEILDFKESPVSKMPLVILQELDDGVFSFALKDRELKLDLEQAIYEHEPGKLRADPPVMSFVTRPKPGLTFRKAFWFGNQERELRLAIEILNESAGPEVLNLELRAAAGIPTEIPICGKFDPRLADADIDTFAFAGQRKLNGKVSVEKEAHSAILKHQNNEGQPMSFIQLATPFVGSMNRYFAVALMAPEETTDWSRSSIFEAVGISNLSASLQSAKLEILPGQSRNYEFTIYAGPLSPAELDPYGDVALIYDLGWFAAIGNLLHICLDFFHAFSKNLPQVVGGYGLAIILLTFLVRGGLHPLNRKAQASMHAMSRLGPDLQKLKDKYGEDKQRYQKEMMGLYKDNNVNPAGGCLPMFLQLPVFIALYRVIQSSVALRGEGFLWMADLSKPDCLLCLPFTLPLLGESLNLLPLLMVALWILQQKLTPKNTTDPQQVQMQKMMTWMPVIFGFMFYGMPSGLVLYFVVSSSLGIVESKMIKKALAEKDGTPVKTSSGFMDTPVSSRPKGKLVRREKKKRDKYGR
ncbi:MAG: membrane protein insertase YidC [Planctomycetota bacterium]|nr:membrane protein insertase YidC [Planctomycetota bacterium]